jgi:hypothetical protein
LRIELVRGRRPHVADQRIGEVGGFRAIPGIVRRAHRRRENADQPEHAEGEDQYRDQRLEQRAAALRDAPRREKKCGRGTFSRPSRREAS